MHLIVTAVALTFIIGEQARIAGKTDDQVVDRTDRRAESAYRMPGMSASGYVGQPVSKEPELPLKIGDTSAKLDRNGDVLVSVRIINVSADDFSIPITLDHERVLRDVCGNRRDMSFNLFVENSIDSPPETKSAAFLSSSSCEEASVFVIHPQGSVTLVLRAFRGLIGDVSGTKLRLGVRIRRYFDKRYYIKDVSKELVSAPFTANVQ